MSNKNKYNRKEFIERTSKAGLGAFAAFSLPTQNTFSNFNEGASRSALLDGDPMVANHDWPSWPIWIPRTDEQKLLEVMRSGVWSREEVTAHFEDKWANVLGAEACLALVNGTNALNTSFYQLGIGWGDEVLVTPYTFIASIVSILFNGAIPVFIDIDPETFQMDPDKIEEKITPNTKAIEAVHICGLPCDMERIMDIADENDLYVVEDACQAHLAEYNNQKVGTLGDAGCFSFQNSKQLAIGEGGAIVSDDREFIDRCYAYHNYGMPHGSVGKGESGAVLSGTKLRMTEYQAAIGLVQMKRLEEQTETRNKNAQYLKAKLEQIPGIKPYNLYKKVTRAAYHLFPFRYNKTEFKELPRSKFLEALRAEGVPCSSGYSPVNEMPYLENVFDSPNFKKFYPQNRLNYEEYAKNNECPINEKICNEQAVWFYQNMLLGTKRDMDNIAKAIEKIHANAEKLRDRR